MSCTDYDSSNESLETLSSPIYCFFADTPHQHKNILSSDKGTAKQGQYFALKDKQTQCLKAQLSGDDIPLFMSGMKALAAKYQEYQDHYDEDLCAFKKMIKCFDTYKIAKKSTSATTNAGSGMQLLAGLDLPHNKILKQRATSMREDPY